MTHSEFKREAKKIKNINILSIKKFREKTNTGVSILFTRSLSTSVVSKQQRVIFYNANLSDIAEQFIYN